jgi:ubiquinone biosynthesis protein UbiJ
VLAIANCLKSQSQGVVVLPATPYFQPSSFNDRILLTIITLNIMNIKALSHLQKVINNLIASDQLNQPLLTKLSGRMVTFVVKPIGPTLNCLFTDQGIEFLDKLYTKPHVTIEGSPLAFIAMNFSHHKVADIFAGKVRINGDIDTAQRVQDLFQAINIDWEEHLAKITGDPIAYHVGKFVKNSLRFTTRFLGNMEKNVSEYLQEEVQLLPSKYEVNEFLNKIDVLRNDVERISIKIQHLLEEKKH